MPEKGQMTVAEAGRKGGSTTMARHGPEFYHKMAKKGGKATLKKHGPQHYEKIGRKGGQAATRQRIQKAKAEKK